MTKRPSDPEIEAFARGRRAGILPAALLAMLLAAPLLMPSGHVRAKEPAVMTLGTDLAEHTFTGKWLRSIYREAFRRLDIPLEIDIYPLKRLSALVDAGEVDGELLRVRGYAAAHPDLIRVEEPVFDVSIVLYAANPSMKLSRVEDLPATDWYADYRRGVGVCESLLTQSLPRQRIVDVTTTEQGIRKLLAGRTDLFCDIDLAVLAELQASEFKGSAGIRALLSVGNPIPLYPYLHKKHAELAPRLAATLKRMKAEGLIQRYRAEAEKPPAAPGR